MMPSGPYKNTCSQALALESRSCTSSHHVQVLTADVVRLDSFGAARGIKHLMLTVPRVDCGRLSSSLSVLEQLQTLWVYVADMHKRQTAGALDLAALRDL